MNTTTQFRAFHGDASIKEKYLSRVANHRKADEIAKGFYWEDGRGCAVGCTIHGRDHCAYERELGIPRVLALLEDRIFENLPLNLAKLWPERFLAAAVVGADLSMVWPRFALWLLLDETAGVIRFSKSALTKESPQRVGSLYQRWIDGDKPSANEWKSADAAAAAAATYAAAAATYDAAAAAAATYAANAAAAATYAADAADAAYRTTRSKHFELMADKLIEIMEAAK